MPTAAITSAHIIHHALFHTRARSFTRLAFSLSAWRAAFAAGPRSFPRFASLYFEDAAGSDPLVVLTLAFVRWRFALFSCRHVQYLPGR